MTSDRSNSEMNSSGTFFSALQFSDENNNVIEMYGTPNISDDLKQLNFGPSGDNEPNLADLDEEMVDLNDNPNITELESKSSSNDNRRMSESLFSSIETSAKSALYTQSASNVRSQLATTHSASNPAKRSGDSNLAKRSSALQFGSQSATVEETPSRPDGRGFHSKRRIQFDDFSTPTQAVQCKTFFPKQTF